MSSNAQAHREACELYTAQAHWEASILTYMGTGLPLCMCAPSGAWDTTIKRYLSTPPAAVLPPPARRPRDDMMQSESGICAALQRKWFFWMTLVQPITNNLVRFASVILDMLPFVKLERLTFVDLVTLPFVNLVTLPFLKICS